MNVKNVLTIDVYMYIYLLIHFFLSSFLPLHPTHTHTRTHHENETNTTPSTKASLIK